MQVCTSLQTDNHASTPLLSFLQAGCPSCRPTNSIEALKAHDNYVTVPVFHFASAGVAVDSSHMTASYDFLVFLFSTFSLVVGSVR